MHDAHGSVGWRMPIRNLLRGLVALLFIVAGWNHFRDPAPYLAMMPPWVPWPETLDKVAGAAEIAGGTGLLVRRFRRAAAWGLLALLVAVFPANLQVALHGWPGVEIAPWILWARLPMQFVFMAAVWWVGLAAAEGRRKLGER